ncbi:MAG TPA: PKD domain-containing protein [Gemmatimonadales bacterium]|nr:PKD domain-containing protein [Gemmatimonadales bacterium]
MRRFTLRSSAALLAGLTLLAGCESSGPDGVGGNNQSLVVLEEGVNLTAVPDTIILDPNDLLAPRDPVTNELIGSSVITALVLDAALDSVSGAEVLFSTTGGTLASAGVPDTTDADGFAEDTLAVTESGPREITVMGVSGAFTKSIVVVVDIAPTAEAGEDQAADCGTPVTLDGSASTDPNSTEGTNDDIVSYEWFLGDSLIAEGEVVEVTLPVGLNVVTLKATDTVGASDTDEVTVTVTDSEPPVVSLRMSPDRLWPPNHKMKTVSAILDIQDCDPNTTVELVSVTSNEPDNGLGDGDTTGDIAGAALGTDDRSVQVRSERSGTGTGRIYTFVYRVTDGSGNATEATAEVRVPHDMGH